MSGSRHVLHVHVGASSMPQVVGLLHAPVGPAYCWLQVPWCPVGCPRTSLVFARFGLAHGKALGRKPLSTARVLDSGACSPCLGPLGVASVASVSVQCTKTWCSSYPRHTAQCTNVWCSSLAAFLVCVLLVRQGKLSSVTFCSCPA